MNPGRLHKIFLWGMGLTAHAGLLATMVIMFEQCDPVESQWNFDIKDGKCMSRMVLVKIAVATAGGSFSNPATKGLLRGHYF